MDTDQKHSRAFHLVAAIVSLAAFLGLIHVLPSLATTTNPQVLIKAASEILLTVALLYALIRWGGVSPERLGVRRVRFASFGWGLLCFIAATAVSIVVVLAFRHFGITQQRSVISALASKPIPIILLIAATAAIAEEILFRSILITELESATGITWLAAAISLAAFAFAHAAAWGPWQIAFAAVPGLVLTLFFLWKRDLWICIIAHFLTDAVGLLGAAAAMAHHS
jgi:membrane protease YdiL (CAAX protease family)